MASKLWAKETNATAAAVFKEFGDRYIARTQNVTTFDGTAPKRFIIAFDNADKARAWNNSLAFIYSGGDVDRISLQ